MHLNINTDDGERTELELDILEDALDRHADHLYDLGHDDDARLALEISDRVHALRLGE